MQRPSKIFILLRNEPFWRRQLANVLNLLKYWVVGFIVINFRFTYWVTSNGGNQFHQFVFLIFRPLAFDQSQILRMSSCRSLGCKRTSTALLRWPARSPGQGPLRSLLGPFCPLHSPCCHLEQWRCTRRTGHSAGKGGPWRAAVWNDPWSVWLS